MLFNVAALGTFVFWRSGHFVAAAVFGVVLTATRPTGILLPLALSIELLYRERHRLIELALRPDARLRALAVMPLGLAAFVVFLFIHVGDPLAYAHIQQLGWGQSFGNPVAVLVAALAAGPATRYGAAAFIVASVALLAGAWLRRIPPSLAAFAWLAPGVAIAGSVASQPRYALALFPLYLVVPAAPGPGRAHRDARAWTGGPRPLLAETIAVAGVTMNLRFIETVGWIGFYGAFIAFALTVRAVSPTYRAVVIERTAADWLPDATRSYAPPDAIVGHEPSPYFGRGWWRPEPDRRWGKGERSTIVVQPARNLPAGSRVKGRIGALLGGSRTHQTVVVEVNGIEVDRLDVGTATGDNTRTFDAPLPRAYAAGDEIEIAFIVPDATSPLLPHQSGDRTLGVCFFELSLEPPN
jgi:hypothetical protein